MSSTLQAIGWTAVGLVGFFLVVGGVTHLQVRSARKRILETLKPGENFTGGEIQGLTGISSSLVYLALSDLEEKGLIVSSLGPREPFRVYTLVNKE